MNDMSVFIKRGPYNGARLESPSSPSELCSKAQGLNQFASVWTWEGATQVGFAATVPALFGSPTMSGRFKPFPFQLKVTPEALLLSTTKSGKPEIARSIKSTSQFPRIVLTGPLQSLPNRLPLPNGSA